MQACLKSRHEPIIQGVQHQGDYRSLNKDAAISDSFIHFGIVHPFPEFVQRDKIASSIQPYEVIPITVRPASKLFFLVGIVALRNGFPIHEALP
jgi:hypothetical protein